MVVSGSGGPAVRGPVARARVPRVIQPATPRPDPGGVPRSVGELAASSPSWRVRWTPHRQWITAERVVTVSGRQWTIGLTPTRAGMTALVLWSGDEVVDHLRGTEAQMCAQAHRWAESLLQGGAPQDGSPA